MSVRLGNLSRLLRELIQFSNLLPIGIGISKAKTIIFKVLCSIFSLYNSRYNPLWWKNNFQKRIDSEAINDWFSVQTVVFPSPQLKEKLETKQLCCEEKTFIGFISKGLALAGHPEGGRGEAVEPVSSLTCSPV